MLVKKGETICTQGFPANNSFKIAEGLAKEYINGRLFRILKEGDFALLSKGEHKSTVIAGENCFIDIYNTNNMVQLESQGQAYQDQIDYMFDMLSIREKTVQERTAWMLLKTEGIWVSRQEQSDLIVCAKETITREISLYREEGLIKVNYSGKTPIQILKREVLIDLATR